MQTFADEATIDGNYPSAAGIKPGLRDMIITATGVFDGATVALQVSNDDGDNWVSVADGSFTAAGTLRLQIGEAMSMRAVVTDAGASTSLTVKAS